MKTLSYQELKTVFRDDVDPIQEHSVFSQHGVSADAEREIPEVVYALPARANSRPRKVRMHPSVEMPLLVS